MPAVFSSGRGYFPKVHSENQGFFRILPGDCGRFGAEPVLAFNEPAPVTLRYEVLEPGEWVGKELRILEHIDIGERLKAGNWLVLVYTCDCSGCAEAIPMYERMARDLQGNEDFLQIALIAVPPYGRAPISCASACILGKLNESKEWFVTTRIN